MAQGQVSGIVLATTQRVLSAYGFAKDLSPMLKTGLTSVESRVPEEWLPRLAAASEPVLARLDSRCEHLTTTVTTRVVEPVAKTVAEVNARVVAPVAKAVVEWKDLRGELSKKAVARLERSMADVREFSATRGKDMIHVDLIAYSQGVLDTGVQYSRDVLDNARTTAEPVLAPLTARVVAGVALVQVRVAELQELVKARSAVGKEELAKGQQLLLTKLEAAKAAARELAGNGTALVTAKYAAAAAGVPEREALEAMVRARLPANLQGSLDVLLDAPALFGEVRARTSEAGAEGVVANAHALLRAVREVLFAPAVDHAFPPTVAAEAPLSTVA